VSKLLIDGVARVFPPARAGTEPTRALEPISLRVADNDFITILGPSGCGKSTLLRIVAGLDRATSGRVLLDGEAVTGPGADRGMVFQSYTLFPWLTIADNIAFGLRERGVAETSRRQVRTRGGARIGLAGFEHHYPSSSRAACSSAPPLPVVLANDPKIMLLDEPFGALDNQTRALMQEDVARHLGAREEDGAIRHARHRGIDLPRLPRGGDERAARAHQGLRGDRPALSASTTR